MKGTHAVHGTDGALRTEFLMWPVIALLWPWYQPVRMRMRPPGAMATLLAMLLCL